MYALLKSLLFRADAEKVHYWVMRWLQGLYKNPVTRRALRAAFGMKHDKRLERTLWGITFPNPVGLGAGFDKDARWVNELATLGFGFVEIGTVTPRPQPGNDKPRLFRLPEDRALINRMGFNNGGSGPAAGRLRYKKERIIIGGNIGKNKDTPNEQAADDYEAAFRDLYEVVDYFVVNVSSPNTPGLRALQDREPLTALLRRLIVVNDFLGTPKPILLKIAPDLTDEQLDDIVQIVRETGLHGIVATNTTVSREALHTAKATVEAHGTGGVSGAPLRVRATEVVRYLHQKSDGAIPIIAVAAFSPR
jgi:dihydroorotate dehydrogenase